MYISPIYNRVSTDSHQVSEEAQRVVSTITGRRPYVRLASKSYLSWNR